MSEAREMTSGADSRSALRRSFLALLSPSSALSEMVLSSPSLSCTSFGSSRSTLSPPLAFVFVKTASEQMRPEEDLRGLRELAQKGCPRLQALLFFLPEGCLLLPLLTLVLVFEGGNLGCWSAAYVLAHYLPVHPPRARVVPPRAPLSTLPSH